MAILRDVAASQKETDRKPKEVLGSIGHLSHRLGECIESMIKPAVARLLRERGIEVHEVHLGVSAERDGEAIEVDRQVVKERVVVASEDPGGRARTHN